MQISNNYFYKLESESNRNENVIKVFPERSNSWYTANTVSCIIDETTSPPVLKLSFTYYDYEENKLYMYNKKDTVILEYYNILSMSDYEKHKDDLIKFGESFSIYMRVKFIILDLGEFKRENEIRFRCNKCRGIIKHKPLDQEVLTKHKLNGKDYKIFTIDYPFLKKGHVAQVNRLSTWRAGKFNKIINDDFYCEDCIQKLQYKFIKEIEANRESNIKRYSEYSK